MVRRPKSIDTSKLLRNLVKTDKYIETITARKGIKLSRNIRKMAAKQKDKQAEEKYAKQRDKGLNMNQLIACCSSAVKDKAIQHSVQIVTLKRSKDKQTITSKSLTYDDDTGVLKVRPHTHHVNILYSSGEKINTPFHKAKRLSFDCDCANWMYVWEYSMAKKWGAAQINHGNNEFPVEKNPTLQPGLCKHGWVLMKFLLQHKY